MSYLGIAVMIGLLSGNKDSVAAWKGSVGKEIKGLALKDDCLRIAFTDNTVLVIADEGQSCCEHRYMVCDDNLPKYIGGKMLDASLETAPSPPSEYDEHEVQFLHIKTSKGSFTVSNHNEHNGYYGGFHIVAKLELGG